MAHVSFVPRRLLQHAADCQLRSGQQVPTTRGCSAGHANLRKLTRSTAPMPLHQQQQRRRHQQQRQSKLHLDGFAAFPSRNGAAATATANGSTDCNGGINVKVCGVTSAEDAALACGEGANFIGMIMWPGSKRGIDTDTAAQVVSAAKSGGKCSEKSLQRNHYKL